MSDFKSILDMTEEEALPFLLKAESYSSFTLPPYFNFKFLLEKINKYLFLKEDFNSLFKSNLKPRDCDGVNHTFLFNKDGRFAWRPLELIHPILYVRLVQVISNTKNWSKIKKKFKTFQKNKRIECCSLPIESNIQKKKDKAGQILNWWKTVEQRTIELSLDFDKIIHSDITNCYASIYTHSIPWALHGKDYAKRKKNRNNSGLVGVAIDKLIQEMREGQTNGIPQGSVLMDFVAEIVLSYVDELLSEKISKAKIEDYHILRYRDDYRIFINNSSDGELILKILSEILVDFGLKLNQNKTFFDNNIISSTVKKEWEKKNRIKLSLAKELLLIHEHSKNFPNSGSVVKALNKFYKNLSKKKMKNPQKVLISVVVDIAFNNPRTYPACVAILSKLISLFSDLKLKEEVGKKIEKKFKKRPNTGYLHVWLQRMYLPLEGINIEYEEPLCQAVQDSEVKSRIWNSNWVGSKELINIMKTPIIDKKIVDELKEVISVDEFDIFSYES